MLKNTSIRSPNWLSAIGGKMIREKRLSDMYLNSLLDSVEINRT